LNHPLVILIIPTIMPTNTRISTISIQNLCGFLYC